MIFTKTLSELHAEETRSKERWLMARREGVGASEVAGVVNASPWSSPLSVYADKTVARDIVLDDATIERFRWGHILERVVLDELSARSGLAFRRAPQNRVTKHDDWPITPMLATPDAYVLEDERRLCQIKTTNSFNLDEWRDGVPLHVNVQVQSEMAVCNRGAVIVVCLIGGQKLVAYQVDRHQKFIDQIEPEISKFWHEHVVPRVLPAADPSPASVRALEKLHPDDNGEEIALPERALEIDAHLASVRGEIKALSEQKKELENEIKAMLGPNTFGRLPDGTGRWSWKTITRRAYQAKESTFRQLRRGK